MEKKRGNQVMAIAALFIAVIGLSLGFAAFSNTLTISSSATVTPDASVFDVNLSSSAATTTAGTVSGVLNPTPTAGTYAATYFTAANASITNDAQPEVAGGSTNARVTGLKANFTAPGQTVTYLLYARNDGQYVGYLNSVTFSTKTAANNETGAKVCYAKTTDVSEENRATSNLVSAACEGISISVKVGGTVTDAATHTVTDGTLFTESKADKVADYTTGHSLAIGASEPILITISYADGSAYVDGPMEVEFGDIILTYGSVD